MEQASLTISPVGQITIPRSIRKLLNIESGDRLDYEVDAEKKTIILKKKKTFDEIMEEMDRINSEYPNKIDPRSKDMTVGEMALEGVKEIEGDTWV
jgi:AbrB family looped-hinge helix DNA binding protein